MGDNEAATMRLAYCGVCRGVLPFARQRRAGLLAGRARFACDRCGTPHRPDDPGARTRRRALRYLVYAALAGMASACAAAGMAAVGSDSSLLTGRELAMAWALAALCLGCIARSAHLGLRSTDFERLTPLERRELDRRLCPGMIRSDVIDDLARRGWSIGKIRTALASLRPAV